MASYCFRPHQAWTQPVAGVPCSPELGLRLWLKEEVSLELRLKLRLRLELGLMHGYERGQTEGNDWVLQEPPNWSLWLSPLLDRDVDQSGKSCRISHPDRTFTIFSLKYW